MIGSIGEDRIDAINWVQDKYGLLRSIAEDVITNSIKSGKIIVTENGVFLTEEEEDFEENTRNMAKKISNKYSRTHFRNHKKAHKLANKMVDSNDGVHAADDMLNTIIDDGDEDALS